MFIDYNRPICYSRLEIIYQYYIFWDFHGRNYHWTVLGVIWNIWNLRGAPVNLWLFNFSKAANFSSAYNTSTGASKYINNLKNYYQSNFQNSTKLCITFKVPLMALLCVAAYTEMTGSLDLECLHW